MKTPFELEALERRLDRVIPLMGVVLITLAYILAISQLFGAV